MSFSLTGDLVNIKADTKRALLGEMNDEEVTPHSVQSYLTQTFIEHEGAALSFGTSSAEELSLSLKTEGLSAQQYGSLF